MCVCVCECVGERERGIKKKRPIKGIGVTPSTCDLVPLHFQFPPTKNLRAAALRVVEKFLVRRLAIIINIKIVIYKQYITNYVNI